jgi:hypothetical protein
MALRIAAASGSDVSSWTKGTRGCDVSADNADVANKMTTAPIPNKKALAMLDSDHNRASGSSQSIIQQ